MSRPNISYRTPVPGPSSHGPPPPARANMGLDPSPLGREALQGQGQGQLPGPGMIPPRRQTSGSTASRSTFTSALDSSITRLLVTTKQLLQGLEQWSQRVISENDVSDIYVRLGNGFEVCIQAFQRAGIPTAELDSIPNDLRACLEQCLSYEQDHETLEVYLPEIRQIIYNLLHGLKQKQAAYKRLVQERQREIPPPATSSQSSLPQNLATESSVAPQLQQDQSRRPSRGENQVQESRLSARSGNSTSSTSPASVNSQLPPTKVPSSQALAERSGARTGLPSRPAPPDAFRPPRARLPDSRQTPSPVPPPEASLVVRHQLTDNPVPSQPPTIPTIAVPNNKPTPPRPDRFSRDSYGSMRPVSRFSADSDITNGSPIRSPPNRSPNKTTDTLPRTTEEEEEEQEEEDNQEETRREPEPVKIAPSLPIPNLPAAISLPDESAAAALEALPDVPPETRATLAALQRSDALERRASKRFSSYTFNKMLPGSPGKKTSIGSPQRPIRRADRPPPMPAFPEGLTNAPLIPSPSDEDDRSPSATAARHLQANGNTAGNVSVDDRPSSPSSNRSASPLPSDRSDGSVRVVRTPEPGETSTLPMSVHATPRPRSSVSGPAAVSVFLQIGRQVKKAKLELPVTFSNLRLLFMERFEYDPGMEDFPDVYLRDNRTGVQFELEDMDDLKDGCVLSLNIEPLDQVKQHFDTTFATLMQEIKEMKKTMDASKRISMTPSPSLLTVSPSAPQMSRRNTYIKPPSETAISPTPAPRSLSPTHNGPLGPVDPERVKELQGQYDEVQSLRRDLAVMRQIHVDFLSDTKESFTKLRMQNAAMREVVKTKMGGSRALLDNSKAKLEARCQDTIQAVEEISDTIDTAREDAYRRFVTPSKSQMANIKSNLEKARRLVDEFSSDVQLADPTWRATWQTELHRVMEEQKLLNYQLKLCSDLKNDIKDAEEMLGNVQDFVNQRAAGGIGRTPGSAKAFGLKSPSAGVGEDSMNGGEGEGGIPHLLMEIRTKETDPNQRLKAIEAQQRAREREKANKVDDFEDELQKFVGGRKLKKTGGTEEAERMRLRRQEQTLRRMMGSGEGVGVGGGGGVGVGVLSPQNTGGTGGSGRAMSPQLIGREGKPLTTGGSISNRLTPNITGGSIKQEPGTSVKQEPEVTVKQEPE
ncbi:hypothetical protein IAR55_006083 [Kwoniella newhampshirensis]|uniref:Actin interacting protein 3 C-terminal domain-containing protein n=1 Tax=Kwoniella newhampshirensis TaxID=1651941 RepID=A0AAW0YF79_9TREE